MEKDWLIKQIEIFENLLNTDGITNEIKYLTTGILLALKIILEKLD
ncbi:hypothetical protein ACV7JQ_09145 [Globicatella sulfidifaciens]